MGEDTEQQEDIIDNPKEEDDICPHGNWMENTKDKKNGKEDADSQHEVNKENQDAGDKAVLHLLDRPQH